MIQTPMNEVLAYHFRLFMNLAILSLPQIGAGCHPQGGFWPRLWHTFCIP